MKNAMKVVGMSAMMSTFDEIKNNVKGADGRAVYSDLDYAFHQEHGTRYQSGTPHVRPAISATQVQMAKFAAMASNFDAFIEMAAMYLLSQIRRFVPVLTGQLRDSYQMGVI